PIPGPHHQCPVPKAPDKMVVDHSNGLHERITNRAANELEATSLEILAHGVRLWGHRRNFLDRLPGVLFRFVADEAPDVSVKRAELPLNGQDRLAVLNGGFDLQ